MLCPALPGPALPCSPCPAPRWADYAILERRSNLGGTWDFFKYPGIRSDSDMYTFGFSWKVWRSSTPIATGDEIIAYLKEAAEEQGITEKIRLNTNIERADWSSGDNRWHLVASSGERFSCNVLFGCTGYFSRLRSSRPSPARKTSPARSSTRRSGLRSTTR